MGMGFSSFAMTAGVLEMAARTIAGYCAGTDVWIYRNLPVKRTGMDLCRCFSAAGVPTLYKEIMVHLKKKRTRKLQYRSDTIRKALRHGRTESSAVRLLLVNIAIQTWRIEIILLPE